VGENQSTREKTTRLTWWLHGHLTCWHKRSTPLLRDGRLALK